MDIDFAFAYGPVLPARLLAAKIAEWSLRDEGRAPWEYGYVDWGIEQADAAEETEDVVSARDALRHVKYSTTPTAVEAAAFMEAWQPRRSPRSHTPSGESAGAGLPADGVSVSNATSYRLATSLASEEFGIGGGPCAPGPAPGGPRARLFDDPLQQVAEFLAETSARVPEPALAAQVRVDRIDVEPGGVVGHVGWRSSVNRTGSASDQERWARLRPPDNDWADKEVSDMFNRRGRCVACRGVIVDGARARRIHAWQHIKPFRCEVVDCGASFAMMRDLKRHVLGHSGTSFGVCECGTAVGRWDNWRKHRDRFGVRGHKLIWSNLPGHITGDQSNPPEIARRRVGSRLVRRDHEDEPVGDG